MGFCVGMLEAMLWLNIEQQIENELQVKPRISIQEDLKEKK